jgi:hypothetical protein
MNIAPVLINLGMRDCSNLGFRLLIIRKGLNQACEIALRIFEHGEGVSMSNLLIAQLLCSDCRSQDGRYDLPAKRSLP